MVQVGSGTLEPRKLPVQARSEASVEALVEATVQVLLAVGKERLTTTRVAARAGVSVGTLYQYFPNKSALLQAALRRHLEEMAQAVEQVCQERQGASLEAMATGLVEAFLSAKLRQPQVSVALYAVSADVDGASVVREMGTRLHAAVAGMLETAPERLGADPGLMATMLEGTMAGVSRRLLEGGSIELRMDGIRHELVRMARAYVQACAETSGGRTI